ncbi:hypothetical protein FB559_1184 [Actinoallomurus bryophytorum]|uniref:Uncharacterized protein n=1 Tax=Actinoallomurus bryophytorum TaxID=1490222 RepID=A0A543CF00_9ACTN|nr:hypothetical protein [Actinoallomurus bryophytorum]TQL95676.1 hypothetical protein FB559_1184 [Actinoallomurus bryophytorum]
MKIVIGRMWFAGIRKSGPSMPAAFALSCSKVLEPAGYRADSRAGGRAEASDA